MFTFYIINSTAIYNNIDIWTFKLANTYVSVKLMQC